MLPPSFVLVLYKQSEKGHVHMGDAGGRAGVRHEFQQDRAGGDMDLHS